MAQRPILDETTRLVPVIATIDNAGGTWRVGENVGVSVLLPATGDRSVAVPSAAVQMIGDKPHVFVHVDDGHHLARTIGRVGPGAMKGPPSVKAHFTQIEFSGNVIKNPKLSPADVIK